METFFLLQSNKWTQNRISTIRNTVKPKKPDQWYQKYIYIYIHLHTYTHECPRPAFPTPDLSNWTRDNAGFKLNCESKVNTNCSCSAFARFKQSSPKMPDLELIANPRSRISFHQSSQLNKSEHQYHQNWRKMLKKHVCMSTGAIGL